MFTKQLNRQNFLFIALLSLFLSQSCEMKEIFDVELSEKQEITNEFNFQTTNEIEFSVYVLNSHGQSLKNVPLFVYDSDPYNELGIFEEGKAKLLFKGITNSEGKFVHKTKIPSYLKEVYICPKYIGVAEKAVITVNSANELFTFGGQAPANVVSKSGLKPSKVDGYLTLGTWNTLGVPNYLVLENDNISSELLERINASLPERRAVPLHHPEYITEKAQENIKLLSDAKLWVTFVHEAAGYKNTLGYYTYPTNNPPQNASEIENLTIIFPNSSYKNSGGGLYSGNKVQLKYWDKVKKEFSEIFPEGTSVGWFVNANGWNSGVTNGLYRHYSNSEFNLEASSELQKHTVLLHDSENKLLLLGFEDIRRDYSSCDQDFNDVVYYVKADPFTAIDLNDVESVDAIKDTDNDGIADNVDDYPTDETKAFDNYYPSENIFGTFIFEDLWPSKGDYDFEDLVMDYNINQITNAQNEVVEINSRYIVKAIGAGFNNGFGFQLSVSPNDIESVEGIDLRNNYISLNANKTEANQSKAVIVLFDNAYNVLPRQTGYFGVNVEVDAPYVQPDTMNLTVKFRTKTNINQFDLPPYNSFLIVNKIRGREIHLPNQLPTDLVDVSFFGTADDNSIPDQGKYYTSVKYYPWAIDLPNSFKHMQEKKQITKGYLNFAKWAESNGTLFQDWYLDKENYRNWEFIYPHGN